MTNYKVLLIVLGQAESRGAPLFKYRTRVFSTTSPSYKIDMSSVTYEHEVISRTKYSNELYQHTTHGWVGDRL